VAIQLGAYDGLLELHDGKRVNAGLVIHAPLGEPIREIPITRRQLDLGALCFSALFSVYQMRKELELK
jgi:hypothetical protein